MGIFQPDFYRFFALGFAGGALLVFGAMGIGELSPFAQDIAPSVHAAESR